MAEEKKVTAAAPEAPAKKPAAKKPAAKKPAAEKPVAEKAAAPAEEKKPVAKKAPAKKPAAKKPAKKEEPKAEVKPVKAPVTEATCIVRDIRVTPRKLRLVADYVRGMNVNQALALLKHLNKSAAMPVYKAIKSAAANATNNFNLDGDLLYVSEIQASDGKRMKRYLPRAKGSASPLVKRMGYLRLTVKERR